MRQLTLAAEAVGQRLDVAVAAASGLSRSRVQKRIKAGLVEGAGRIIYDPNYEVLGGETIVISEPQVDAEPPAPQLPILYEDDDLLIIDKPAGLVVHPTETGRVQPSVAAFAREHGVEDDDPERPGIVHRLDKDTSGAMVVAKHPEAKRYLQKLFRTRKVTKTYLVLLRGRLKQRQAEVRLPIGRDRRAPVKRAVVPGAREATTTYRVLKEYPGASLVEVGLQTGRTHQIRVHFSHLGHPVIGDRLYGETKLPAGLTRQFLHAHELALVGPSGRAISVRSPLPPELNHYLDTLEGTV